MDEDVRRTNAMSAKRFVAYKKIAAIFDQLEDEFKAAEIYKLTGIKDCYANRMIVATLLDQSFRCSLVGEFTPRRRWKKKTTKVIHED
jgi:hypothetical protein